MAVMRMNHTMDTPRRRTNHIVYDRKKDVSPPSSPESVAHPDIHNLGEGSPIRRKSYNKVSKHKLKYKLLGMPFPITSCVMFVAFNCFAIRWILFLRDEMLYRAQVQQNLQKAKAFELEPLVSKIDREQFTIRINTWQRNEQLLVSLNHHTSCPGVAQIQVVWCDPDQEAPESISNHTSGKVVVERHTINSLTERFNAILRPPTIGVMNLDDDVLWPCEALDSAFFRWTKFPHRLVGFDPRLHLFNTHIQHWEYKHQKPTEKHNEYTLVLTRAAFAHRDYLDIFTKYAPSRMLEMIERERNCEDIAFSFFVSYMSPKGDKLPLLADRWARNSDVKLVTGAKISTGYGHSRKRNECIELFLKDLDGLEHSLRPRTIVTKKRNIFQDGLKEEEAEDEQSIALRANEKSERESMLLELVSTWKSKNYKQKRNPMIQKTVVEAYDLGLIMHTIPWSKRFNTTLDANRMPRFHDFFEDEHSSSQSSSK